MQKTGKRGLCVLLSLCIFFSCTACSLNRADGDPWDSATYREDQSFGDGAVTVQAEVIVGDRSVTFTVRTDKETLGGALVEHGLIDGEPGEYGLYVKVVNGITADYDIDQSYWALYKGGEMMMVGVDGAALTDGEHYELVYTK